MTRRWVLLGLGIFLSVNTANTTRAAAPPATTSTQPAAAAKLHTVARGAMSVVVEGEAQFEAVDPFEVRIRSKVYAADLTVTAAAENGSHVKKGDVLLQIDPTNLKRDLQQAENDLALARANLAKAKEDVRLGQEAEQVALAAATRELENARTNLKWFDDVDGPNTLKMADLQLKEFKDGVEDQQDELDQLKKMYKTEELTSATADIVVKRAVRRLARTNEQLPIVESGAQRAKEVANPQTRFASQVAADRAKVTLEQLKVAQEQGKVARETSLVSARIAAERAEQKAAELRADLDQLTVRAPADGDAIYGGMVGAQWQNNNPKALRPGDKVAPHQVLLTLVEPGKVRAVLAVPENKLSSVRVGAKATVNPKLKPQTKYAGTVTRVAPLPGPRGNVTGYDVWIDAGTLDPNLMPAMTATVKLEPEKVEGVLLVPVGAVAAGKVTVRGADGKDQERDVTVGRSDGKMVEVVNGLTEGEQVVTK